MGTSGPRVSVVLPTYNRADVVDRAIESVLDQTYTGFELVVVDDASTDDTDAVVGAFDDDRIRYVEHRENRGASAARNTGIRAATGEIIAFQDSDDVWGAEKLERQVAVFDRTDGEVGVVYTGTWRDRDGERRYVPGPGVDPKSGDVRDALFAQNFVTTQAAAVRAPCFERVGTFDEDLPALVDWELWLRVAEHYEFRYVDEPLVTAHVRADSISRMDDRKVRARERIVRKHRDRFPRKQLARQLFWVGHGCLKVGRPTAGRRYLTEAMRTDWRLRYLAAAVLSVFGSRWYSAVIRAYKAGPKRF